MCSKLQIQNGSKVISVTSMYTYLVKKRKNKIVNVYHAFLRSSRGDI